MIFFLKIFFYFYLFYSANGENVLMTEVFEISLDPFLFNWTYEGIQNQYMYQPSLFNAPDLPSWINYRYSERHQAGFLFGVPPNKHGSEFLLQVVALNKKTYETRQSIFPIHITEKLNPAKNEVQLKIDNLNVEDMFDSERMNRLKDVFRKKLWKASADDLYATFLASAIELGARLPPNPEDGEGVVLRFGSTAPFSDELHQLQAEVKPLSKVPSCPRNFKRTTVERYFREANFILDWCAFRLFPNNSSIALQSTTTVEKLSDIGKGFYEDYWDYFSKDAVPKRSYAHEFTLSVLLPLILLVFLGLLLSLILCFHHEGIEDEVSEIYFDNIFHICTDYYQSKRLKGMDNNPMEVYINKFPSEFTSEVIDDLCTQKSLNISPNLSLKSKSHVESPTLTLNHDVHVRPSPPPYVRPKFKPSL